MLKRLAFVALIVAALTITAIPAYATSGACSGHEGVNCAAGPSSSGNVTCNDEWTGSSVMYLNMRNDCGTDFKPFLDVDNSSENVDAIYTLYENNIIEGYDDFTFKPENQVNRAEFLKILIEAENIPLNEENYKNCFSDVTEGWYAKYVCFSLEQEWIEGYEDGTFKPDQTVNKAEAIKILMEIHGWAASLPETVVSDPYNDVSADDWFAPYVKVAQEKDFVDGDASNNLYPGDLMSRADIAEMTFRSMVVKENSLNKYSEYLGNSSIVDPTYSTADFENATEPRTLGDSDAVIEIIGYNDYQCPFCKLYVDNVLHQLTTDYIETGKVKYTFKDFPLSFHAHAKDAAHASRCAEDQGKYFEMHDILFANQNKWTYTTDIDAMLDSYATELELDEEAFGICMTAGTHIEDIDKDMDEGIADGVQGTPSMIVNGELIVGAPQYETFSEYLDALYHELSVGVKPVITSPVDGGSVAGPQVIISGTAEPNHLIWAYVGYPEEEKACISINSYASGGASIVDETGHFEFALAEPCGNEIPVFVSVIAPDDDYSACRSQQSLSETITINVGELPGICTQ